MDRFLEKIFFEKILTTRWSLFQRFSEKNGYKVPSHRPPSVYIAYLKVRFGTAIPNHAEIIERIMLGKYVQYLKSQQRPETFPTENLSFDSL